MQERKAGLPPATCPDARALILGSMPSAQSLLRQEYYGNPRNHFWPLLFALLRDEPPPADYADRLALLRTHKIALWDSIAACERPGSLDARIKNETPNDIPAFLKEHPGVRAVLFNGTKARQVYLRYFPPTPGVLFLLLPSSSPIPRPGMVTMQDKLPVWREAFARAGF